MSREEAFARYRREVEQGTTFHYIAQSNLSMDRMNRLPMISAFQYSEVLIALGKAANMGDRYAAAVSEALRKVSPYFTAPQLIAGVSEAFLKHVNTEWVDVRRATGPDSGRPSQHRHAASLHDKILLLMVLNEIQHVLSGSLGTAPGMGWALKALIEEENIHFYRHNLPYSYTDVKGNPL